MSKDKVVKAKTTAKGAKAEKVDKALVAAAEDINSVFRPAPPLDTAAKTLVEDVKELFPGIGKGKGLKAETIATLKGIGFLEKAKPVEKPVAKAVPKAGKTGKTGAGKRPGIGAFVKDILGTKAGWAKGNKDILDEVLKQFPEANTTAACIAWYRMDMKRKGLVK